MKEVARSASFWIVNAENAPKTIKAKMENASNNISRDRIRKRANSAILHPLHQ
jgi:hypothetical protein